jgi:hypothetical protein
MLKHGTEGYERTWEWLITAARVTVLGKIQFLGLQWRDWGEEWWTGHITRRWSREGLPFIATKRVLHEFGTRWSRVQKGGESPECNCCGARWGKDPGSKWVLHCDLLRRGNTPKHVASSRRAADADDVIPAGREASGYSGQLRISSAVTIFSLAW